jgi:hypothetical protein
MIYPLGYAPEPRGAEVRLEEAITSISASRDSITDDSRSSQDILVGRFRSAARFGLEFSLKSVGTVLYTGFPEGTLSMFLTPFTSLGRAASRKAWR